MPTTAATVPTPGRCASIDPTGLKRLSSDRERASRLVARSDINVMPLKVGNRAPTLSAVRPPATAQVSAAHADSSGVDLSDLTGSTDTTCAETEEN